mmetsp:Transcript_19982/g.44067  ORF Transcript_19982/g.44067 Transcript_19982/m.44067 type:complete len:259 (-) Transcript_19982:2542-3318(-)
MSIGAPTRFDPPAPAHFAARSRGFPLARCAQRGWSSCHVPCRHPEFAAASWPRPANWQLLVGIAAPRYASWKRCQHWTSLHGASQVAARLHWLWKCLAHLTARRCAGIPPTPRLQCVATRRSGTQHQRSLPTPPTWIHSPLSLLAGLLYWKLPTRLGPSEFGCSIDLPLCPTWRPTSQSPHGWQPRTIPPSSSCCCSSPPLQPSNSSKWPGRHGPLRRAHNGCRRRADPNQPGGDRNLGCLRSPLRRCYWQSLCPHDS